LQDIYHYGRPSPPSLSFQNDLPPVRLQPEGDIFSTPAGCIDSPSETSPDPNHAFGQPHKEVSPPRAQLLRVFFHTPFGPNQVCPLERFTLGDEARVQEGPDPKKAFSNQPVGRAL